MIVDYGKNNHSYSLPKKKKKQRTPETHACFNMSCYWLEGRVLPRDSCHIPTPISYPFIRLIREETHCLLSHI